MKIIHPASRSAGPGPGQSASSCDPEGLWSASPASRPAPDEGSGKLVGAREWLGLPEFGIACIQARLDSRSEESTLSALNVALANLGEERLARFQIRPIPGDDRTVIAAEAPLAACSDDNLEPVIWTPVTLGEETWPVELRLVRHHPWRFRLRLGRPALTGRFTVDPNASFRAGPPLPR